MQSAIEYINVSKNYKDKCIIKNLNLTIKKGEFVTIIGKSGCGKTTILKMANGLNECTSGDVLIDGEKIVKENAIKIRRKIGYCMQGNVLFPHMTVEKNIHYKINIDYKKDKQYLKNKTLECLETVGLNQDFLKMYPHELSGGQQQRVSIARAISTNPDILLMDEPFSAIDSITKEQLQKELIQIYKKFNTTILFITHDIDEALNLGTKILVINDGKIEQYDEPQIILNNPKTEFIKNLINRKKLKMLN